MASGDTLEPPLAKPSAAPPSAKEEAGYPDVPLAKVATKGGWVRPRAKIVGTVSLVRIEEDGDIHIRVEDGASFVVLEIIPELPLKVAPRPGDKIRAWGVVRWDGEHGWGELHPLCGWEKVK